MFLVLTCHTWQFQLLHLALDCVLVRVGFELLLGRPLEKADSGGVRNDGLAGKHVDSPLPQFFVQDCSYIVNDKIIKT